MFSWNAMIVNSHFFEMEFHNCRWHSNASGGRWGKWCKRCDSKIITKKYALIGKDDFEFKKVRHKRVTDLELAPNLSFSYPVIKKMASQGVLYIELKAGSEFYLSQMLKMKVIFCSEEWMKKSLPQRLLRYLLPARNIHSDTNMNQEDSLLSSSINKTEQWWKQTTY